MRDKIDGLHRDFTAADLARLQDACGVGGAIVVQAMHNHRESERLLAQATGDSRLAGVVAWADLFDPALAERVVRYRKWPKFLGLRPLPPDTFGGNWIADPRCADRPSARWKRKTWPSTCCCAWRTWPRRARSCVRTAACAACSITAVGRL